MMEPEKPFHVPKRKDQAPDTVPWDNKTQEQRAACLLDHLVHEHLSGNLRPASKYGSPRKP